MLDETCCCSFETCQKYPGRWSQSRGEVNVEIVLKEPVKASEVHVKFSTSQFAVSVLGQPCLRGELYGPIHAEESTWMLENGVLLRLMLSKAASTTGNCWKALFADLSCAADDLTFDRMEKNLVLERFQVDNPAMDFSDADVSGNYHDGGPRLTD